jgi:hypothetical protein
MPAFGSTLTLAALFAAIEVKCAPLFVAADENAALGR